MKKTSLVLLMLWFSGVVGISAAFTESSLHPLSGITIVLDPGHGGSDPGAIGPLGLKESVTNLRVAKYLAMLLKHDGAKVVLTRESDIFVSLEARVNIARKERPDLFISIHHNASLKSDTPNHGEVYFNALDRGIPLSTALAIREHLQAGTLSGEITKVIPGGFYVLRENPTPAVLTEAAYISHPEIEKKLRSGLGLVEEAQMLRLAVRKAFSTPPFRFDIIGTKPFLVRTPYFQILISSTKPLAKIQFRMTPPFKAEFTLDLLSIFGNMCVLANSQPIYSGKYVLSLNGVSVDGGQAPQVHIPLDVRLPVKSAVILPPVPYIPQGYIGSFPIAIQMLDAFDRPNRRAISFNILYPGKQLSGTTNKDGKAGISLLLNGKERGQITVAVEVDGCIVGTMPIAVKNTDKRLVVGRIISSHDGSGIARVKLTSKPAKAITDPAGYFSLLLPKEEQVIKVNAVQARGYLPREIILNLKDSKAEQISIPLSPRAPAILGRRIGIIADRKQDRQVFQITKALTACGAEIKRFPIVNSATDAYEAVTAANFEGGYDLLIAIKYGSEKQLELRHYHSSRKGKLLATNAAAKIKKSKCGCSVKALAGSDYELGHSAATALVIQFPQNCSEKLAAKTADALMEAISMLFVRK